MFRDPQGRVQRIGAYAVCVDEQRRILLCRITAVTNRPGWWTLPGGGVDFGEHPIDAVVRELHEETGLDGRVDALLEVDSLERFMKLDGSDPVDFHAVRVVYRVAITGGDLVHEQDGSTDRAEWFTEAQLASLEITEIGAVGVSLAFGPHGIAATHGSSTD